MELAIAKLLRKTELFNLIPHAKNDNFAGGNTVTESCVFFSGFHYLQFNRNQLTQETKLNRILAASHSALHKLLVSLLKVREGTRNLRRPL